VLFLLTLCGFVNKRYKNTNFTLSGMKKKSMIIIRIIFF
jgi:hypothetical protein